MFAALAKLLRTIRAEALVQKADLGPIGPEADTRPRKNPRKQTMKKITSFVLAASLAFSAPVAFAGGPVVVEEEGQPEVVADSPRSGWVVPVVVGLIIICAIACDNGDSTTTTVTAPTVGLGS
jgi:hypothetical protein